MGYKYSFLSNETYGAHDINEITKRLVTSGVEDPFVDGVPHNLKCFNDLSGNVATDGVVYESDVSLKVIEESATSVSIQSGTAFFNSGATITVDADKVFLDITAGEINYIYVEHNEDLNIIQPVASLIEPEGDIVMLAVIDENGNIEDRRKYAHGKLPRYVSGYGLPKNFEFTVSEEGTYEFDMQGKEYSCFTIIVRTSVFLTNGVDTLLFWTPIEPDRYIYSNVQREYLYDVTGSIPIRIYNTSGDYGANLSLKYEGNILYVTIRQNGSRTMNCTIEIKAA